jgi:ferritin
MLLDKELLDLFNYRINQEEASSRLYLKMSIHLQDIGYFNAAKLWRKFANEELEHADIARDYLLALDIEPETRDIIVPDKTFVGLDGVIRTTLEHELEVTQQCEDLAKTAMKLTCMKSFKIAQKYVEIQIHELEEYHDMKNRLDLFGTDPLNLRMYDNELKDKL